MFFSRKGGLVFTPRAIVSAYDFGSGDFTKDGAWHDLDISAIVPVDAVLAQLKVRVKGTTTGLTAYFGAVDSMYNGFLIATMIANVTSTGNVWVPIASGQILRYLATSSANWTELNVVIRGWLS